MGNVARAVEKRNAHKSVTGNLKERGHLEDLGVDWKTIFKWELQMQRLNLFGSERGPIIELCGHCNKPSVDTKRMCNY